MYFTYCIFYGKSLNFKIYVLPRYSDQCRRLVHSLEDANFVEQMNHVGRDFSSLSAFFFPLSSPTKRGTWGQCRCSLCSWTPSRKLSLLCWTCYVKLLNHVRLSERVTVIAGTFVWFFKRIGSSWLSSGNIKLVFEKVIGLVNK